MNAIMLDSETLGTTPGCIVLSIGAVEFNETSIIRTFEVHIDPFDSAKHGLHMDVSTVMWWLDQPKAAQEALFRTERMSLVDALESLIQTFDWTDKQVWCNGAAFDFPILDAAFKAAGLKKPWPYYNEMDLRTVKNLAGKENWPCIQPELKHDALSDAIAQARNLMASTQRERFSWAA